MSRRKSNTGIPGLTFSWKRALGITQAKQKFARETGIPTSRAGVERKIGNMILKALFGKTIGGALLSLLWQVGDRGTAALEFIIDNGRTRLWHGKMRY